MVPSATAPASITALMAGRICSMELKASKTRKMSMPVAAASATKWPATESG